MFVAELRVAKFSNIYGGICILVLNFQDQEYSCNNVLFSLFLLSSFFVEPIFYFLAKVDQVFEMSGVTTA